MLHGIGTVSVSSKKLGPSHELTNLNKNVFKRIVHKIRYTYIVYSELVNFAA